MDEVLQAAKEVFFERTFEKATMKDIADKAEIGIASVYRYYANKQSLVLAVAIDYLQKDIHFNTIELSGSGIEKTAQVLDSVCRIIEASPRLILFMEQFVNFLMVTGGEEGEEYRKLFFEAVPQLKDVITQGILDGSIRKDIEAEGVSECLIDIIFIMAQKHYQRAVILRQEDKLLENKQIILYKEMVINYLKSA